jgi:hypothetical protein
MRTSAPEDHVKEDGNIHRREDLNLFINNKKYLIFNFNSMVRERTIPTERPPLLGEVIASFCG